MQWKLTSCVYTYFSICLLVVTDFDADGTQDCYFLVCPNRAVLDLTGIEGEKTHGLTTNFDHGGSGTLSLLVTISGTTASETISDLSSYQPVDQTKEDEAILRRYVSESNKCPGL